MGRFVFVDRDGVLNRRPPVHEYVTSPEDFVLLPGVRASVQRLHEKGYSIVVVSNQQGVAKGRVRPSALDAINEKLRAVLEPVPLLDIFVCPHGESEQCMCRKPRPGMLLMAARRHEIDIGKTFFIGDLPSDICAGRAAGTRTIMVGPVPPEPRCPPEFRAEDLEEAVTIILREDGVSA